MSRNEFLEPVIGKWASDACKLSCQLDIPTDLEAELNGGGGHEVGGAYANLLDNLFCLGDRKRILEIGCGYGRIAMHVAPHLSIDQSYVGLDPHKRSVEWAANNISPTFPNMAFVEIDVRSGTYNPQGGLDGKDYALPIETGSINLVYMTSVFTHLDFETTRNYIHEIARVLAPQGAFFSTHFLMDRAALDTFGTDRAFTRIEIPYGESYVMRAVRPEDAIAHPVDAILDCYDQSGLHIDRVDMGFWRDKTKRLTSSYQDHIIAFKGGGISPSPVDRATKSLAEQEFADEFETVVSLALNATYWRIQGYDVAFPTEHAKHRTEQLKDMLALELDPNTDPVAYHPLSGEISVTYLSRSKISSSHQDLKTALTYCWEIAEAFRRSGAASIAVTVQDKTVNIDLPPFAVR